MKSRLAFINCMFILVFLGFSSSCNEDCPDGYSGEDCTIRESDPFIASYEGFVNCGPQDEYTTVEIFRDSGPFQIDIVLTYPPDFTINATVRGDTLLISEQVIAVPETNDTSYYIVFDSEGLLHGDSLDFSLILLFPGIPDQEKIICDYKMMK